MNAESFWKAAARRLDAGTPVFVSLVVANTRGSPGTRGARLLLDPDGVAEGTVGGGIMEAELIAGAHRRLQDRRELPPTLQKLVHRKTGTNNPSGLICAGEQTNLNLTLDPQRDRDAIRVFCQALEDQAHQSARLIIDASGLRVAQDDAPDPRPDARLTGADGQWRFEENSINPRRLAIVGGGHCGKALARLGADIGYWVDVFDSRPEVLQAQAWPDAVHRHLLNDYGELSTRLDRPSLATVVVMTAAVYHDISALAAIAAVDLHWLGVMGSAAKIHKIRRELRSRGILPGCVDAIHGPIGLRMKSDTPAEIAVSIMAQLLAAQSAGTRAKTQPDVLTG